MQTIEAELERALFEAGAIAESNYGFLQKVSGGRVELGIPQLQLQLTLWTDRSGGAAPHAPTRACTPPDSS